MSMNNRGFTTIELILAILIAGIIMGAVGTFITFNMRSFNGTTDIIDIQYEGQLAVNQIVDIARESTGIVGISDLSGTNIKNRNELITPGAITFEHKELVSGSGEETTIFRIAYVDHEINVKITYNDASTVEYVIADNISSFKVKPVNGINFETAKGMDIQIELLNNEAKMNVNSQVKFRNKR